MEINKRDYFAAQALTGLLARSSAPGHATVPHERLAAEAFLYADAMLKLSKTLLDPVEIDPQLFTKAVGQGRETVLAPQA
jgi:hypothetical protein